MTIDESDVFLALCMYALSVWTMCESVAPGPPAWVEIAWALLALAFLALYVICSVRSARR
jgi:MYXO-CTERM domain-containing protein